MPSGSSFLAAVQAEAGGVQGRPQAPQLDTAHLPAPLPLYIGHRPKDECPLGVFFHPIWVFGARGGGGGGGGGAPKGAGAQPAYAVFDPRQVKNGNFGN